MNAFFFWTFHHILRKINFYRPPPPPTYGSRQYNGARYATDSRTARLLVEIDLIQCFCVCLSGDEGQYVDNAGNFTYWRYTALLNGKSSAFSWLYLWTAHLVPGNLAWSAPPG